MALQPKEVNKLLETLNSQPWTEEVNNGFSKLYLVSVDLYSLDRFVEASVLLAKLSKSLRLRKEVLDFNQENSEYLTSHFARINSMEDKILAAQKILEEQKKSKENVTLAPPINSTLPSAAFFNQAENKKIEQKIPEVRIAIYDRVERLIDYKPEAGAQSVLRRLSGKDLLKFGENAENFTSITLNRFKYNIYLNPFKRFEIDNPALLKIMVFSLTNVESLKRLIAGLKQIHTYSPLEKLIFVGNKLDLVRDQEISPEAAEQIIKMNFPFAQTCFLSCQTCAGVDTLNKIILEHAKKTYPAKKDEAKTQGDQSKNSCILM